MRDIVVDFVEGDEIGIPCQVKPGPFSGERLISFETVKGPVSGFVRTEEVRQELGKWLVRAIVRSVKTDSIEVWVRGSFFTTNGIATISREMDLAA